MNLNDLPKTPGTYAVILRLDNQVMLAVGRLGAFTLPAATYLYAGSAFGPGGLQARLGRHLRGTGRPHWHIDALRPHADIRGFCYTEAPARLECAWSQALAARRGAFIPAPGFGASDCAAGCPAHLIAFEETITPFTLARQLARATGVIVKGRAT